MLAPQLRQIALDIARMESQSANQAQMLNSVMDLHNDLTDWATNTEHTEAGLEVMAILETYIKKVVKPRPKSGIHILVREPAKEKTS